MKKLNYFMCGLLMAGSMFTVSCSKDDDDDDSTPSIKQVSAIVESESDNSKVDSTVFTYNSDGLLAKAETYGLSTKTLNYLIEYTYLNKRLVTSLYYEIEGTTKIPADKDSIGYDSNNLPVKIFDYRVTNGKFELNTDYTTVISYNSDNFPSKVADSENEYYTAVSSNNNITKVDSYVNKTLNSSNTYTFDDKKNPFKGNPYFLDDLYYYNTNNFASCVSTRKTETYTYEYNSDGYPTKATISGINTSGTASTYTALTKIYYK